MLNKCRHCGQYIETRFGADAPADHADAQGTREDPHAPGDWDDICARCNYDLDLRGGPNA